MSYFNKAGLLRKQATSYSYRKQAISYLSISRSIIHKNNWKCTLWLT